MTAAGTRIGTGYVRVEPDFSGFQEAVAKKINTTLSPAAQKLGQRIGKDLGKNINNNSSLRTSLQPLLKRFQKFGDNAGEEIASHIGKGSRRASGDMFGLSSAIKEMEKRSSSASSRAKIFANDTFGIAHAARDAGQSYKLLRNATRDWAHDAKAADSIGKRLSRGITSLFSDLGHVGRNLKAAAGGFGNFEGIMARANRGFQFFGNILGALKFPALIAGAALLAQSLSALAAGAVATVSALGPLSGALVALPAAALAGAQAVGVLKLALSGIGAAVKAGLTAQIKGGEQATETLRTQENAAEALADAHRTLSSSERDAKYAQEDLTKARKEATRQLEDMRIASEESGLTEREGTLALREARRELNKTLREPASSGLDIQSAEQAVEQAKFGLEETRADAKRARADYAEAQKKGVEGMPEVVSAKRALADANRSVADAERGVAKAVRENTDAMKQQGSAATALDQKLAALTPTGRKFAKFLISLKPQLDSLRETAAQGLFPGAEKGVKSALGNLSVVKRVVGETAGAFGKLAAKAGAKLGSKAWGRDLGKVGAMNTRILTRMGDAGLNVADAFRNILVSAEPLLEWMSKGTVKFSEWLKTSSQAGRETGDLGHFFDETREAMERVWRILKPLGEGLLNVGHAAKPLGNEILDSLGKAAQGWADWTKSTEGQNKLKRYFVEVKPAIFAIGRLVRDMTNDFFELGRQKGVATVVETIRKVLLPVLTNGAGAATGFVSTFLSKFNDLHREGLPIFDAFVVTLAEHAGEAGAKLAGALGRGFLHAGIFGKLAITGLVIKMFGGVSSIVKAGTVIGGLLGDGISTGAAAGGIAGGIGRKGASTAAKDVGQFGEKQALRDAGLIGGGAVGGGAAEGLGSRALGALPGLLGSGAGLAATAATSVAGAIVLGPGGLASPNKLSESIRTEVDLFQKLEGLNFSKSKAQLESLQDHFAKTIKKLRSDAILGMGAINQALGAGLEQANETWLHGTPQWRTHVSDAMRAAIKEIKEGMEAGTVDTKEGQKEISRLLEEIHIVKGNDPFGLAKATAKTFKDANGITSSGVAEWIRKLERMPKGAREKALDANTNILKAWADGHPKIEHQIAALTQYEERRFGTSNKRIADQFGDLNTSIGSALKTIIENTRQALDKLGVKGALKQFTIKHPDFVYGTANSPNLARQRGGPVPAFATGGLASVVPGNSTGDRHVLALNGRPIAKVESREGIFVGNRKMMAAAKRANDAVPRFQSGGLLRKGGMAEPKLEGHAGSLKQLGQQAIHKVFEGAKDYIGRHSLGGGMPGLSVPTGPIVQMARQMVERLWNRGEWAPFAALETREANWNPRAVNPTSGAAGLAQALPPSKYPAGAWPYRGLESAKLQLQWMVQYIKDRYGSPSGAWAHEQSVGWYQRGGPVKLAKGGEASASAWRGVGASGLQSGIRNLAAYVMEKYPSLQVTSTTGGTHAADSYHYKGQATDLAGGNMDAAAGWIKSSGLYRALVEGIHNPNLSVEGGHLVDPSFWGSETWADHADHIHLAADHPWSPSDAPGSAQEGAQSGPPPKEDIPPEYHRAKTGPINFGPMPRNLDGVKAAIAHWQGEVGIYRKAKGYAEQHGRPDVAQAVGRNLAAIEQRLAALAQLRTRLRLQGVKKGLKKRLGGAFKKMAGYDQMIEGSQLSYESAAQYAEQVVGLEPQSPELPASASDGAREAAEKDYVKRYAAYVENEERPAYGNVLSRVADWRNTILKAELFGFGDKRPSVSRMQTGWEGEDRKATNAIDQIKEFAAKVKERVADYRKNHKGELPDGLKEQIKKRDAGLRELPILQLKDSKLREAIGKAREAFFPGGENRLKPNAAGIPVLPLPGSGALEERLKDVQGIHRYPDQHEQLGASALAPPRLAGRFGGALWDVQTTIEELGLKVSQAFNGLGSGGSGGEGEGSERASLLEQLLREANQRTAVSEAQGHALEGWDKLREGLGADLPKFHAGGQILGPANREVPIMAKVGETMLTERETAAVEAMGAAGGSSSPHVNIESIVVHEDGRATVRFEGREFEAAVEKVTRKTRGTGVLTPGGARR